MTRWMADTSVVVAAIVASHEHHESVDRNLGRRTVEVPFHAALEAYSVLTRLPGEARLSPANSAVILRERFGQPVMLDASRASSLVEELADLRIAGGAVYDALIAATAASARSTLLTRDRRAAATYELLKVSYEIVA